MLGFNEDEIGNGLDEWASRIHPDDKADTLAVVQDYFDGKVPVYTTEHRVKCKDGSYKWILDRGIVVSRDAEGKPLRMIGTHTDITEHKQMEEKLRDSDAFNVSILNSLTSHIAVLDAQGVIVAVNNAWRRFADDNGLLESSQSTLYVNYLDVCKNASNETYGDEADAARAGIAAVLAGEQETFNLEYPCHSSDQQRWFSMNVSALQGSRRGVVVSHKNITERKKAEEIAQAASQYARSLIEASLDPLVTISAEGKITDVNSATEQVTGVSRDNLIASDFADYFMDPEKARAGYLRVFSQGFVTDYPLAIRHASGKVTEVLYNASLYRDGHGNVLGVFAAARDITERKHIEAELIRSNAELEQFAYAVSHDMRQPLRMVSSYLSLIESALAGQLDEETQQFLDFAVNGANRMDAMILSLLDYSRVGRKFEAKTQLSSKESLDEALAFLNPELNACGGAIKVTGDWPDLFASGDELTRLLQNLIGNALKYHQDNQPPQVHVHGEIRGGSLRVEVRDNGIGIAPNQLNRLFKVFSRLQARSRFEGTGVGLALCRKIVEHHGGAIGVESAGEGQGCMFWFELPVVNAVNPE
jgi:PAS domain S-box-containing protein